MTLDRRLARLEASAGGNGSSPTGRRKRDRTRDPVLEALSLSVWSEGWTREAAAGDLWCRLRYVLSVLAQHDGNAKAALVHLTEVHDIHGRPIKVPADAQWNEYGFVYLDADGRQVDDFIRELHPRGMAFQPSYRKVDSRAGVSESAMREMYRWLLDVHLEDGKGGQREALQGLEELERLNILFVGVDSD